MSYDDALIWMPQDLTSVNIGSVTITSSNVYPVLYLHVTSVDKYRDKQAHT